MADRAAIHFVGRGEIVRAAMFDLRLTRRTCPGHRRGDAESRAVKERTQARRRALLVADSRPEIEASAANREKFERPAVRATLSGVSILQTPEFVGRDFLRLQQSRGIEAPPRVQQRDAVEIQRDGSRERRVSDRCTSTPSRTRIPRILSRLDGPCQCTCIC